MKITLEFAELHTPLFHNGKNFGLKLDLKNLKNVELIYDRSEKELWISYLGKSSIIPVSNVVSMTPKTQEALPITEPSKPEPMLPKGRIKAQVSTPTSHVFSGEGEGLTRDR